MIDRRKLNNVYTVPCGPGMFTIYGEIGSGKTKETVILQKNAPFKGSDFVTWWHHRGEQWSKLKELVDET